MVTNTCKPPMPNTNGHVVSMLSIRDLMRTQIVEAELELAHLRAYIWQVPTAVRDAH